jgi:monoamine oxidase
MNIVIIGAGAAGLAAGTALRDVGHTVTLLEARDRVGGRVWTNRAFADFPIENGAEFVHGDRAATWDYLHEMNARTIAVGARVSFAYELGGKWVTYDEAMHNPDLARVLQLEEHELAGLDPNAPDRSVRDWVASLGLTAEAQRMANQFLSHPYLAEPDEIGVADLAHEMRVHHSGAGNFRVYDGYDRVMQHMARGLDIRFNTVATRVQWSETGAIVEAEGIRVENHPTEQVSARFPADKVIITVPLSLLQKDAIRFDPALPEEKRRAIHALRMGPVVKLHLAFSEMFWQMDISPHAGPGIGIYIGSGPVPVWWSPALGRDPGVLPAYEHVFAAFVGGRRALALDEMSEAGAINAALEDLCRMFGSDAPRRCFTRGERISWQTDPFARGGYSFAPVGAYGARQAMAKSVGDVLFFAGEACVTESNPATVHGAIESGWRAAKEITALG